MKRGFFSAVPKSNDSQQSKSAATPTAQHRVPDTSPQPDAHVAPDAQKARRKASAESDKDPLFIDCMNKLKSGGDMDRMAALDVLDTILPDPVPGEPNMQLIAMLEQIWEAVEGFQFFDRAMSPLSTPGEARRAADARHALFTGHTIVSALRMLDRCTLVPAVGSSPDLAARLHLPLRVMINKGVSSCCRVDNPTEEVRAEMEACDKAAVAQCCSLVLFIVQLHVATVKPAAQRRLLQAVAEALAVKASQLSGVYILLHLCGGQSPEAWTKLVQGGGDEVAQVFMRLAALFGDVAVLDCPADGSEETQRVRQLHLLSLGCLAEISEAASRSTLRTLERTEEPWLALVRQGLAWVMQSAAPHHAKLQAFMLADNMVRLFGGTWLMGSVSARLGELRVSQKFLRVLTEAIAVEYKLALRDALNPHAQVPLHFTRPPPKAPTTEPDSMDTDPPAPSASSSSAPDPPAAAAAAFNEAPALEPAGNRAARILPHLARLYESVVMVFVVVGEDEPLPKAMKGFTSEDFTRMEAVLKDMVRESVGACLQAAGDDDFMAVCNRLKADGVGLEPQPWILCAVDVAGSFWHAAAIDFDEDSAQFLLKALPLRAAALKSIIALANELVDRSQRNIPNARKWVQLLGRPAPICRLLDLLLEVLEEVRGLQQQRQQQQEELGMAETAVGQDLVLLQDQLHHLVGLLTVLAPEFLQQEDEPEGASETATSTDAALRQLLQTTGQLGLWAHREQRLQKLAHTANWDVTAVVDQVMHVADLGVFAAHTAAVVLSEAAARMQAGGQQRPLRAEMPAVQLEAACGLVLWGVQLGLLLLSTAANTGEQALLVDAQKMWDNVLEAAVKVMRLEPMLANKAVLTEWFRPVVDASARARGQGVRARSIGPGRRLSDCVMLEGVDVTSLQRFVTAAVEMVQS